MNTLRTKPLFWVSFLSLVAVGLIGANYAFGFWPFTSPKVQITWANIVLQSINPRICVSLLTGSVAPSSSASGPGCTGNVGATGPGVTSGTAICSVLCPAGKAAKVIKYTGTGAPFVSFDQTQGKYICNGKPTVGASSIQCECQ
ncbi:MAG: hypothetical protein G01um101419_630 [Parcubacteria group bacterium Gr01-1014_19]|nr:MAG: hypothetical protein G01um101419_630 [Parcubacteria group bacterium Gr01-1014_19]